MWRATLSGKVTAAPMVRGRGQKNRGMVWAERQVEGLILHYLSAPGQRGLQRAAIEIAQIHSGKMRALPLQLDFAADRPIHTSASLTVTIDLVVESAIGAASFFQDPDDDRTA